MELKNFNADMSDSNDFNKDVNFENESAESDVMKYPAKKAFSGAGFSILTFVVLFNILVLVGSQVPAIINGTGTVSVTEALIVNLVVEVFIAFPVYYLLMKKIPAVVPEKRKMGFGNFMSAVAIMYCISIIGSIISSVLNGFLSDTIDEVSTSGLEILFENNFLFSALYCVILAPAIEELVFRKVLIDRLQCHSKKMAILVSGLSFGLMHGNLEQFFYTFFIGCFFAFIYTMTGKIKYCIGLHFLMNGVSVLLSYVMTKITFLNEITENPDDTSILENVLSDETQLIAVIVMALIVLAEYGFAFVGLVELITKRGCFAIDDSTRTISAKDAFLNPGIIISFGVMLAIIVVDLLL